jgi:protoporphyrin/coproporphyrin ferrochelatase
MEKIVQELNFKPKKGVLLVNLGTPVSTKVSDVRKYLREFLSDPRVIDIPAVFRMLLLYLVILPFRPSKSAHAYRSIWTSRGSPLLVECQNLASKVQQSLGSDYAVELGMRYAEPSLKSALEKLEKQVCETVQVIPLFPHYSAASTGSALQKIMELILGKWNIPSLTVKESFYNDPGYLDSFAQVWKENTIDYNADFVLFSYHGVPERHMTKSDTSEDRSYCLANATCCNTISSKNSYCYKAQCYATTRGLVKRLGFKTGTYETSFQSRLGRTPWIRPYTDVMLEELAKKGHKNLAVFCPAFTADCLETLEEIGIRAKEDWIKFGGEDLRLIPSLNAHPLWVKTVCGWIEKAS